MGFHFSLRKAITITYVFFLFIYFVDCLSPFIRLALHFKRTGILFCLPLEYQFLELFQLIGTFQECL